MKVQTHCCILSITCPTLPASTALPHIAGALALAFFRSRTSEGCCTAMERRFLKQATSSAKKGFIYIYIYGAPPSPAPHPQKKEQNCQNASKDAKSSYNLYIYIYVYSCSHVLLISLKVQQSCQKSKFCWRNAWLPHDTGHEVALANGTAMHRSLKPHFARLQRNY